MFWTLFLKGFLIGFSIAMPVGPIGLLCIRNSLTLGFLGGVLSGLGAAIADALFGALAGLGLSSVNTFLEHHSLLVHTIGACFLIFIGIKVLRDAPAHLNNGTHPQARVLSSPLWALVSTFLLTLVNPLTILSYAAIYASVATDITNVPGLHSVLTVASGVFFGSLMWWLILSSITVFITRKLDQKYLVRINLLSGIFLIFLGLVTWLVAFW